MTSKLYKFRAVGAKQAPGARVFTFAATASDVLATCEISRAGRGGDGKLFGFQRPQIAGHIQEIRDYLQKEDAVLPNAVVVGFLGATKVKDLGDGVFQLSVSTSGGKPGFVVDGQQRLTALSQAKRDNFEVFVSCVICDSEEELRRQFILINNTRPLPKSLIYELLAEVNVQPKRLTSRAFAAKLTEMLNFRNDSSLNGLISMHTNPGGAIKDTSLQKVIMNSADSGALRDHAVSATRMDFAFQLLSNFYQAVAEVFPDAWHEKTPRTSRLIHGAGIISMGYVMETLYSRIGGIEVSAFKQGLEPLAEYAAWTSGAWTFSDGSVSKWDEIENTPRQIQRLALHLVGMVKRAELAKPRKSRRAVA
ncbi:DGQHR domain-containing protein DpdB [Burkholderia sp. GbtcB21]|uniref:DGQHR domain-containing protein DpdB n=1 Tax=Burkholderia sp. GbtcB21 TaxID=2824766 RepID=UPI001C30520A|nr:DGQHR domain-containing protein DpdB [Burkholderia sp. GbtcB21]